MNRYAKPANFKSSVRTPLLRMHFVYRAFDHNGVLLYIGCSYNPEKRIAEHKQLSLWAPQATRWTLAGPYNYEAARLVEYQAIESERSIYNFSSERRELKRIRDRFISRNMAQLIELGVDWPEAGREAIDLADFSFHDYHGEMLTDLAVPEARRIDRLDAEKVRAA